MAIMIGVCGDKNLVLFLIFDSMAVKCQLRYITSIGLTSTVRRKLEAEESLVYGTLLMVPVQKACNYEHAGQSGMDLDQSIGIERRPD